MARPPTWCSVLLALLALAAVATPAAAVASAEQEEPLRLTGEREASPIDTKATKALLASYDEDASGSTDAHLWNKHINGHCSYNGYRVSRCPRAHECKAGHKCIVTPPCGLPGRRCGRHHGPCCSGATCDTSTYPPVCVATPTCGEFNATCAVNSRCCSNNCLGGTCCAGNGTLPDRATCTSNNECCSNHCGNYYTGPFFACCAPGKSNFLGPCVTNDDCCFPYDGTDGLMYCALGGVCQPICWAGGTLVNARAADGSVRPTPIEELRVGMDVQCLATSEDLRTPQTLKWCPLKAWLHASPAKNQHVRISFTRPDGSIGSTTLAHVHYAMRLTGDTVAAGDTAARVDALGAFENVASQHVRAGDKLVLSEGGEFVAVAVTAAERVEAAGMYNLAVEHPFIIADGLVAPIHNEVDGMPVVVPPGVDEGAATNAAKHFMYASLWMHNLQPAGLSSVEAASTGPDGLWSGVAAIRAARETQMAAHKALDFSAMRAWFLPRYRAWKRDPDAAITLDEVSALLRSDAVWTTLPSTAEGAARGNVATV